MKYNKGFAPLILLAIIVGALMVGGGAVYFATKTPTSPKNIGENNYQPQENQNSTTDIPVKNNQINNTANNNTTTSKDCLPTTTPWIKVLSPNGGETFTAGQQITIKWTSCNMTSPMLNFSLMEHNPSLPYTPNVMNLNDKAWLSLNNFDPYIGTPNDGIEKLTLPKSSDPKFTAGQNYFMNVYGENENSMGVRVFDFSDNLFSIQKPTQNQASVTTWKIYKGKNFEIKYPSDWKIGFAEESVFFDFPGVSYNLGARFEVSDSVSDINYWVKEFIKDNTPFVQNDITIDNLPAKKVSFTSPASGFKYTFYHVGKGDIGFRMFPSIGEYIKDPIEINKIQNIFEEMAFSFKFK